MVERSLSMREVRGSIPRISRLFLTGYAFCSFTSLVQVAVLFPHPPPASARLSPRRCCSCCCYCNCSLALALALGMSARARALLYSCARAALRGAAQPVQQHGLGTARGAPALATPAMHLHSAAALGGGAAEPQAPWAAERRCFSSLASESLAKKLRSELNYERQAYTAPEVGMTQKPVSQLRALCRVCPRPVASPSHSAASGSQIPCLEQGELRVRSKAAYSCRVEVIAPRTLYCLGCSP